jgi:7-cyano-7-deazaguanine reductase
MSKKHKENKDQKAKDQKAKDQKIKEPKFKDAKAKQLSVNSAAPNKGEEKRYGTIAIEEAELERFENRTRVRRYTIEFTCPEFTCLCPRSGFPDFATIRIKMVPDKYCVELKSLKLYINKFRDKHVFHEDVTNIILEDLVNLLDPWEITVVGDFTVRGNIHTVITASHSKED